jgi:hypothetical protein
VLSYLIRISDKLGITSRVELVQRGESGRGSRKLKIILRVRVKNDIVAKQCRLGLFARGASLGNVRLICRLSTSRWLLAKLKPRPDPTVSAVTATFGTVWINPHRKSERRADAEARSKRY